MLTATNDTASVEGLAAASEAARLKGDYREGARLAQQAADLARALDLPTEEAQALRLLANQLLRTGAREAAADACTRAAELDAATGNEVGRSQSLTLQATAYLDLGLEEEALHALAISLEIAQRLRDPLLLFWTYNRIGNVHAHLGKHIDSRAFLRRALPFATGLGAEAKFCILNNIADNGVDLAYFAREQGDAALLADAVDSGLHHAQGAIELARAAAHPYREAICLGNLAMLLALKGDETGARQALTRSHAIAAQKGYMSLLLDAGYNLGRISILFDDPATAIAHFEDVLPALIDNDEKPMILETHRLLSELYLEAGKPAEALDHYKRYHAVESRMRSTVAATRARMVTSMTELSSALLEAERAKLETRLHQLQLAELETEKRELLIRTQDLDRKAHEDDLTGLKNRRYARNALAELIADCPSGHAVHVAIADADHFKAVNDKGGHAVGDEVLRRLATILATGMDGHGFAARLGGEEFLLAFAALPAAEVVAACDAIRLAVAGENWSRIAPDLGVTVSIGLTRAASDEPISYILSRADAALYRSKSAGRNRVTADFQAPPIPRT
ncbi:MAG: diguanylate cyclase [Cypionkella sp.]